MNPNPRTTYGVFEITRKIARRVQQEWEAVESPPPPPHRPPFLVPFTAPHLPPPPREKRPLAA